MIRKQHCKQQQTSITQAKLGNVILNYPELIAWGKTSTVQNVQLIQEKITLLRPVLLALLENDNQIR